MARAPDLLSALISKYTARAPDLLSALISKYMLV